ncbi:tetratricopeptide repeat protein [Leptolyngbya sp. DQ-M1]|uniref:tetratricopeptide repeat protein n=1 Tax=Leptolyngbya sp. DQ-M1 TaxID=2933920 RepID=UPI003297884C
MDSLEKGCECCQREEYLEAIKHFDQAIGTDASCSKAWNFRGNALSALKRYAEALSNYDRATFLQPDYHQAWFNRGLLLMEMGAYGNAIESYDRAIDRYPDPAYIHARASIGLKQKLVFV